MAGGVVVLGAVLGLTACSGDEPQGAKPTAPVLQPGKPGESNQTLSPEEAGSARPGTPPNDADVTYVRDMIVHHRQAIQMAVLVPDRGADEQVKGLASRIADAQGPEIEMMDGWLKTHNKPPVPPAGHGDHNAHEGMPGMATPEQMDQLKAAKGAEFDKLFLRLMIAHHQGALAMADTVRTKGTEVRVQEMADDVTATQSAEIRRMQEMLGA
ncbi:DUF305 domain-containing protein [Actinokineospora alba]|uniref:DUF305 domain-containing protein n=1 Tax=Actinokineospora alba TaxID=504798 RepID=UPI000B878A4E|nr:DUF305 domain-containing protein [Actinokineospora alba]